VTQKEVELLRSNKQGIVALGVPVVKGKNASLHVFVNGASVDLLENLDVSEIKVVLRHEVQEAKVEATK
jgi:2-keto-4-pentenoate hydratase